MDRLRSPLSHTQFTDRLAASTTTTTYASPPTASFNPQTSPFRGNLKDEVEERQRLERQNFDLKLKVFHLEETIKKLQDVEVRNEVHSGMARSELSDLRLQLEEKNIELEQRDLYLVKAKAAIETLKVDLERARQDLDKQADVEDRIRRLKQMNDEIELDYKNQLLRLEAELNQSRQNVGLKHQEKSMLEEKIVSYPFTFDSLTWKHLLIVFQLCVASAGVDYRQHAGCHG